jgi:hypothetical protein
MTSPISAVFSFLGGGAGSPAHMRREEQIQAQQGMAQEQQLINSLPQPQQAVAPQAQPTGPTTSRPMGPSQSFLSAAAATPQQNTATKTLLGA